MSALKKKKKKDFPAWHPDFRVGEDLPDIKAVRTDFLINIGSIVLALALLFWIAYREATINSLQGDLGALTSEQKRLEPENRQLVLLNSRFLRQKQLYDDLEKFYDIPVDVPRFLADIADFRPEGVSFEEIAFQEMEQATKENVERSYRIYLRGETKNLQDAAALKESLEGLPYLQDMAADFTEGSNPRNPVLNTFGFTLDVRFEPKKKEGG